jgi:hypothetical protein
VEIGDGRVFELGSLEDCALYFIQQPKLADQVRYMALKVYEQYYEGASAGQEASIENDDSIKTHMKNLILPLEGRTYEQWASLAESCPYGYFATLIIATATNLSKLYIQWTRKCLEPLLELLPNPGSGLSGLCLTHLKELHLEHTDQYEGFALSNITPVFSLPSLDRLTLHNCFEAFHDGSSFRLDPESSQISSLILHRSAVSLRALQILAAACHKLQMFKYHPWDPSRGAVKLDWAAEKLFSGIFVSTPNLTNLQLNFYDFGTTLLSSQFNALYKLETLHINFGGIGSPDNLKYLPMSIKSLTITHSTGPIKSILEQCIVLKKQHLLKLEEVVFICRSVDKESLTSELVSFIKLLESTGIHFELREESFEKTWGWRLIDRDIFN